MPTNLPPEYFQIEKEYRAATSPEEKAKLIEELLSVIPKHKGTDHLRADYRRRLSKLKETAHTHKKSGRQSSAFHVDKEGAGHVILVGMPNVGKSSLVAALTHASPEVSPQPMTTWTPTPGMMPIEDIQVQLVDTPPLSRDFVDPELMDLVRRADLLLLVIDLEAHPFEQLEETAAILEENQILPAQRRERTTEQWRTTFIPFLVVVNKCDDESLEEDYQLFSELLEGQWRHVSVSATTGHNVDHLKSTVFEMLGIVRVYSKPPKEKPDLGQPYVIPAGTTVEELAGKVHKDFVSRLKSARLWGSSVDYDGQMVGRDHVLQDKDTIELHI